MNHRYRIGLTVLLLGTSLWLTGCCRHCHKPFCRTNCDDIPAGAIPQPLGNFACGWQNRHIAEAERQRLVIYQAEWIGRSTELGPFGERHLGDILQLRPAPGLPIVVERSDDLDLDTQRQQFLVQVLAAHGYQDPEQLVVVGFAEAEAMYGQEAPRIYSGYIGGRQGGGRGTGMGGRGGMGGSLGGMGGGRGMQLGI